MTDFDFEILAAISLYGEDGVERAELERKHFQNYNLLYALDELAKGTPKIGFLPNGQPITLNFDDSAYLKKRVKKSKPSDGTYYEYWFYSLTFKGKFLLQNWQRRQKEKAIETRRRKITNFILSCFVGVGTGIIATIICSKILGL